MLPLGYSKKKSEMVILSGISRDQAVIQMLDFQKQSGVTAQETGKAIDRK